MKTQQYKFVQSMFGKAELGKKDENRSYEYEEFFMVKEATEYRVEWGWIARGGFAYTKPYELS